MKVSADDERPVENYHISDSVCAAFEPLPAAVKSIAVEFGIDGTPQVLYRCHMTVKQAKALGLEIKKHEP